MRFTEKNIENIGSRTLSCVEEHPVARIRPEAFLEQLTNPKTIEIENAADATCQEVTYVEVVPEEITSDEWVLYIGGFGASALSVDGQLFELARRGRKVLFVNPREGVTPAPELAAYAKQHNIPETIQCKVAEILLLLGQHGVERMDVVGHSQGGAVAALLSAYDASRINQLILDTPAGLSGPLGAATLVARGIKEAGAAYQFAKLKYDEGDASYLQEWKRQVFFGDRADTSNFLWRLQNEIQGVGKTSIVSLLKDIRNFETARADGASVHPKVTLVNAQGDNVFPPAEIEATLGPNPVTDDDSGLIDRWVMYASKTAGHGFLTKNDPKLLADLIEKSESKLALSDQSVMIADLLEKLND